MNILPIKLYAKQLSFDNDMMWIELNDGRNKN